MSETPRPPIPAPDSPEAITMVPLCAIFRRFLKSLNLKYTPERADILNAIIEREGIFEVEDLLTEFRARENRVSKATVYRTIKLLQDCGIITQVLFDRKQAHYQLTYGTEARDQMVCMRTGQTVIIDNPELRDLCRRLCVGQGWEPVGQRVQIFAISPEGSEQARDAAAQDG